MTERLVKLAAALVTAVVLLTGCSVKMRPAGDEDSYRVLWARNVVAVDRASNDLKSGVCDKGGDQTRCHSASADVAKAVDVFIDDLSATSVPDRFAAANAEVVAALRMWRDGLRQRNRGFELQSDSDFAEGNESIRAAAVELSAAYELFPERGRPIPGF